VIGRRREFFVQFKDDEKFNRMNTLSILRIKFWIWLKNGQKRPLSFSNQL